MKAKNITSTNAKGQIVIPKEIRDKLGITPQIPLYVTAKKNGVYIQPIQNLVTQPEDNQAYLKLLDKTQGAWVDDDWQQQRPKRRKAELKATEKNKQSW